ncbi:MAG: sugar-binding transcriptional regulator [Clostridia bacterium]|nr:sugar-binding transcriptional regulator [Clostridia bacterium]
MVYEDMLMVKAAWYYYFEGKTQQQIADLMGIHRMRVVKLLDAARQNGVVRFQLRKDNESRMSLEQDLISRFHLEDAFIVPAEDGGCTSLDSLAEAASMYIRDRLGDHSYLNIGYGNTPHRILNNLATMADTPLNCISLTGGVSYYLPDVRSHVFNARLHLIPSPLITSSPEMARAMREEASVQEITRLISLAEMSVVGIGAMDPQATIFRSGVLTPSDLTYLEMHGAAGDLLCHFFDDEGHLIETPLETRLVSTSLETLCRLKRVIGVAAGEKKVRAIRAALRTGSLNVLITDIGTAEKVLTQE